MFHPGERDTVGRFSELASLYDSYRPDYPATAIDFIMERAGLQRGMRLIDIGCGTGISSRQFAERGLEVIGIEPNSQMRQIAESLGVVTYRGGTAEATGMPDTSADAVLVAQAFHWFPTESALRELLRILKPAGWLALIWNDRDDADPFTAGFDSLMRVHSPDPELSALRQSETGMVLLHSQLFDCGERFEFPQQQSLTVEQFLGRANSVSFAPREPLAKQRFETALRELHARFASNGIAALRYRTALFLARKPLVPNRTECYARDRLPQPRPDKGIAMSDKKSILIIDDDRELVEGLRLVLERQGYDVYQAHDGHQGKQMIYNHKPNLVILDMMMPRMGGYPVLEHFRGKDAPPIIMITANEGSRHKAYAEYLGVVDYIRKPFATDRLLESVNKVLGAKPAEPA